MKTTTKILIVLALILGLCSYLAVDVYQFAPKDTVHVMWNCHRPTFLLSSMT